jgi:hypothetical protein
LLPLTEIAHAHPEAEGFEIWSQDEARVRTEGADRLCLVAARPYPRACCAMSATTRLHHEAVCPARDTGVAVVMAPRSSDADRM